MFHLLKMSFLANCNLKAEMGIRSLHQKMDLLLGEQIKKLYDLQAVEIELLKDLKDGSNA